MINSVKRRVREDNLLSYLGIKFPDIFKYIFTKDDLKMVACGSRVTSDKITNESDYDFLILSSQDYSFGDLEYILLGQGFYSDSQNYKTDLDDGLSFHCYKNDATKINFIITKSKNFFDLHKKATDVCLSLNIESKTQRQKVFQSILYDNVDYEGGMFGNVDDILFRVNKVNNITTD